MFHPLKTAGIAGLLLAASLAHAAAQDHPWLDPKLLDAAKAEGGEMTIYSDTNEGEGLPLFKLFEAATGIKTNYVRGADPPLMARMVVEFRGNQKAWDVAQLGTMDKIPAQLSAAVRSVGSQEHRARGARQGPALVRPLRQLQRAGLQHPACPGRRPAEDLRRFRAAQGLGRPCRHRRHRQ